MTISLRRSSIGAFSHFSLGVAQVLSICAALLSFCTIILPCWVTVITSKHDANYGLFMTCKDWKNCSGDVDELYRSEAKKWWIPILFFEFFGFLLTVICAFIIMAMFAFTSKFQPLKIAYVVCCITAGVSLVIGVIIPVAANNYDKEVITGVTTEFQFSWGPILAVVAAGAIIVSLFFVVIPRPKQPAPKMSLPSLSFIRGIKSLKGSFALESSFKATPYEAYQSPVPANNRPK